jgi:solute carrier family 25 carnitine/acylcarnitine transporter 20/29
MLNNEFFLGYLNGSIQILIGHPLDTIKVLQQRNKSIKKYNCKILFKGLSAPLILNSSITSIQFGLNNYFHYYTNNYFISGFLTGSISSIFLNPIEVYKIRLQNNKQFKTNQIFRGINLSFLRESIACLFYFGIYNYLTDKKINSFISGGISGWASWLFTYNLDVIKTRIQSKSNLTIKEAINQGNLWRGFGVCSIRSFIVNGTGFYFYNLMKTYNLKNNL